MKGMSMKELLGPLYEMNLPYILAALKGEKQVFERRIPLPQGGFKDSIATYTPDIVDGAVRGFLADVADVTQMKEHESALERTIRERDNALEEVKTLRGLLPVCSFCMKIRDEKGTWQKMEDYISARSQVEFTHGFCAECARKHYGVILPAENDA